MVNNTCLFNFIAPVYGLYYENQKKRYAKVLDAVKDELDITRYQNIIDVGCGTGALCSVLNQKGLAVTGVDTAQKMLKIARDNAKHTNINYIDANVLKGLPFEDKYFDISIASYVAHGLPEKERKLLYAEMARITKHRVIIYDYNEKRSLLTTIAEWIERGDYFHFIKKAELEMNNCVVEQRKCFSGVTVVNIDVQAAWYIGTPSHHLQETEGILSRVK